MDKVTELIDWLNGYDHQIPIQALETRLKTSQLNVEHFADYIQFSDERYQRNLLAKGAEYYALIMCWKPGQASPIHDHRGAACGVLVLQGSATETSYQLRKNRLEVDSVVVREQGSACGSFDTDIHEIRNNTERGLVTLHVYSPCLTNINIYDLHSGEVKVFSDPLVEATQQVSG